MFNKFSTITDSGQITSVMVNTMGFAGKGTDMYRIGTKKDVFILKIRDTESPQKRVQTADFIADIMNELEC